MIDRYGKLIRIPEADKKVVLLQSGGLDSFYMAGLLSYCGFKGKNVHHLFIDYGQNARVQERDAARYVCESYSNEWHEAKIDARWFTDSSIIVGGQEVGEYDVPKFMGAVEAKTYVPMRNHIFLAMAASLAESLEIQNIAAGLDGRQNRFGVPLNGTGDKHIAYIKAAEKAFTVGSAVYYTQGRKFQLITPLVEGCKENVIISANELHIDLSKSWTCYNNSERQCGTCCACIDRLNRFYNVGMFDPAFTADEVRKYLNLEE